MGNVYIRTILKSLWKKTIHFASCKLLHELGRDRGPSRDNY